MSPNLEPRDELDYAVLFSILGTVPLLLTIVLCACWKRTRQKDDWMGLEGMVTHKNPDENVNHLTAVAVCAPQFVPNGAVIVDIVVDDVDSKRPASDKKRRSLPDIPPVEAPPHFEPNGDNSSELYATVEQPYQTGARLALTNGSVSQHSSISQADDPYARVGYKKENPYAEVNEAKNENRLDETRASTKLLQPSTSYAPPPPPPQSATNTNSNTNVDRVGNSATSGSNRHSTGNSNNNNNGNSGCDISAASAVAGDVAASQELPYMTPPNVNVNVNVNGDVQQQQINFSGDSQDSSKGYTSITVREPIKNIQPRITKREDPTYSDDSDEMYQTIPDANQAIYTSGSETYAQIQPQITIAVEINNPQLQEQAALEMSAESSFTNQNSNRNTHGHSRQGSSSSSVLNLGSPKPERRPVNSPLPPPPSSGAVSMNSDKQPVNLNDMYAKVNKPRKKDIEENKNKTSPLLQTDNPSLDQPRESKYVRKEHNYETIKKSPKKQSCSTDSDPGYEKLQPRNSGGLSNHLDNPEPGYESLHSSNSALPTCNDPNYEQLRPNVGGSPSSRELTVDGYSVIRRTSAVKSQTSSNASSDPTPTTRSLDEPNYESVPSESASEHLNYSLLRNVATDDSSSDADPNYESLVGGGGSVNDPNYESVKYLDLPYEECQSDVAKASDKEDDDTSFGYERIRKGKAAVNPDYETVRRMSKDGDDIFQV